MTAPRYPDAVDPDAVGTYPVPAKAAGGLVWDAVLEYRVWLHPERGAPDLHDGNDYLHVFASYDDAAEFAAETAGAEEPLALVLQEEYIDEAEPGSYEHVKEQRVTEWPVEFLSRPKRTPTTIPDFLAPDAPANRLAILRGEATAR
jgi:putative acetyltransferase